MWKIPILLTVIVLTLSLPVHSEDKGKGGVRGVVLREDGGPLFGASVRIQGTTLVAKTGEDGSYQIPFVTAGRYWIDANMRGFVGKIWCNVEIKDGEIRKLDFVLREINGGSIQPPDMIETDAKPEDAKLSGSASRKQYMASTTLRGWVRSDKGEPLVGANVLIRGTNLGTTTSNDGSFFFPDISQGIYDIEARIIGYIGKVKRGVEVRSGERRELTYVLTENPIEFREVEVTSDRRVQTPEDARTSFISVEPRTAKILPGVGEDVFRTLQAMPGVVAPNDFTSQLVVRGSGPDQNLIVMDGVEIFNPYRLYGFISMFNPETVTDINLIAGGFPAKYGDRLSAVLDVTNKEGGRAKPMGGNISASISNANVVLEGPTPFGLRGSWLISARRTYYDLIVGPIAKSMGVVDGEVAFPSFSDVQSKIVLGPFASHKVILNGLLSRDATNIVTGDNRVTPDSASVMDQTSNQVFSGAWYYSPSKSFLSRFVISWYRNRFDTDFAAEFLDPSLNPTEFKGISNDSLRVLMRLFGVTFGSGLEFKKLGISEEIDYAVGGHEFEGGVGIDFINTSIRYSLSMSPELRSFIENYPRGFAFLDYLSNAKDFNRYSIFLQDKWKMTPRLVIQPGLRYDYYGIIRKSYISPRFNLSLAVSDLMTARLAWGIYYQSPGYEKLFDRGVFFDLTNSELSSLVSEKATHYVLGLERWITNEWLTKFETYYKKFGNLVDQQIVPGTRYVVDPVEGKDRSFPSGWTQPYPVTTDSVTSIPVNASIGDSYGFEISLDKRYVERGSKLTGWISYALAWAQRYRDGRVTPFNYDQRHTINLVVNYRFSDAWELGIRWRYGSNFPYTPAVGVKPRVMADSGRPRLATDFTGRVIFDIDYGDAGNLQSAYKPPYHRLDARLTAYTDFWGLNWAFYLDVINIYNRQNILGYRFVVNQDGTIRQRDQNMFPIIPTIGVAARF